MANSSSGAYKTYITGSGVVDSSGACTITINQAPSGSIATGSVIVYTSPSNAEWIVMVNGQAIDLISGPCNCQGLQVASGDELTLSCMTLQGFEGQVMNATFSAVITDENNTDLLLPGHDTFFPTVGGIIQRFIGTGSVGPGMYILLPARSDNLQYRLWTLAISASVGGNGSAALQNGTFVFLGVFSGEAMSLSLPGVPVGQSAIELNVIGTGYAAIGGISYDLVAA